MMALKGAYLSNGFLDEASCALVLALVRHLATNVEILCNAEMHSKKWSVDEPPKRRAMPSTGIFFVHLSAQAAELHDDVLPKHACILLQVCV